MVLLLKQWKSRSSPGFAGGVRGKPIHDVENAAFEPISEAAFLFERESASDVGAGWSSPVARQAHNLKVAGSNPAPATNKKPAFERAFLLPRRSQRPDQSALDRTVPNPTLTHIR